MKTTLATIATVVRAGAGFALLLVALSPSARAVWTAPELDPGSIGNALALLAMGMLMVRGRRRR